MSEENKRWRCPYCDGLNDWQNTVCEICGDGRRDEADAAVKTPSTAEMPKTYTPPKRRVEPEALRPEPVKESRTAYAPPPPPAPEPPKKKKKGGVWIAILIVVLAALGGRFLADNYVKSVEANKPTVEPLAVIETSEPTAQPEAASQPEAAPQPHATEAPQAEPAVMIDTVTDNRNGTATIKLKINQPADRYNIYWYCLGPDKDAERLIQYQPPGTAMLYILPRDQVVVKPPEDTVTLEVIPGCYTAFFVNAATMFESSAYWASEPYFFEESPDAPPFTVTDVKLLKWNTVNDWKACSDARLNSDLQTVHKYASEYAPTSAQALNDLLRQWAENESEAFLGEEILVEQTDDIMYRINWEKQYYPDARRLSFSEMLSGPGFHVMNFIKESLMYGDAKYTFLNIFHDEYRLLEKFGGYPPGDYTLDFFYSGFKVYTMRFTLN